MILVASITRSLLALPTLQLNAAPYKMSAGFEPGQVQWRRQTTSSPFVDGDFTIGRSRQSRQFVVPVYVRGADHGELQTSLAALDDAFEQDTFTLTWSFDGDATSIVGETADRAIDYRVEFLHAPMCLVTYTFPARPVPTAGVV